MKKTNALSQMNKVILLSTVVATSLFATNGDEMIGLGAQSRALGGTGIAMFTGAENALTNPALLGKMKSGHEFSFGGTAFKADVKVSTTAGNTSNPATGVSKTSDEGMSMIPAIAIANKLSDGLVFGLGMYGTAGMGTDWRGSTNVDNMAGKVDLYNMRSSLMLMQFAPSLAYSAGNFGVGVTAIMQYGALSVDFDTNNTGASSSHTGNGISNDFGYGYQIGAYFDPTPDLTLGVIYKSAIDMEYKDQISKAAAAFGYGHPMGNHNFAAKTDHLEQPAQMGVGIAYNMGKMTYTGDVKEIKWGDAKGYKDFGWENQTVYALGAKYSESSYWLGLGFNYGKNPIPNNTDTTSVYGGANTNGDTMNLFNYAMFPATVETMYTMGGGFDVSKGTSIDLAYTFAPEVSDTVSAATVGVGDVTTKHSQSATTVALKYKF